MRSPGGGGARRLPGDRDGCAVRRPEERPGLRGPGREQHPGGALDAKGPPGRRVRGRCPEHTGATSGARRGAGRGLRLGRRGWEGCSWGHGVSGSRANLLLKREPSAAEGAVGGPGGGRGGGWGWGATPKGGRLLAVHLVLLEPRVPVLGSGGTGGDLGAPRARARALGPNAQRARGSRAEADRDAPAPRGRGACVPPIPHSVL